MTSPDLIERYLSMFRKIEKSGRWKISGVQRRTVALILATVPLDDPYEALESAAAELRRRSGWFGPLSSPIRYSVAAMVIRRGLPPGRVHDRTERALDAMKGRGLPWAGPTRVLAAVLLAMHDEGTRIPAAVFERMAAIHRLWKKDHPWITGGDDYPMLALHAMGDASAEALSARIEETYQELRTAGLPRGNALQLTTQILAVLPWSAGEAAGRFISLLDAFEARGERMRRSRYDECALLSLVPEAPDRLVDDVLDDRDRLRCAKPRPSHEVAFGIATGLRLARLEGNSGEWHGVGDLAAVRQVQVVVEAQQAAMAAAIAGATAAAASAGS